MAEPVALEVVVGHLADPLDAQRLPSRREDVQNAAEILARYRDTYIEDLRRYASVIIEEFDRIPSRLASHDPVNLSLALVLTPTQ